MQRDRWLALVIAGMLVAWWAMGMAYKRYRAEPYPALSMPGFAGNCGLTGSVYHEHLFHVEAQLADGRVVDATLVDTLLRCGMKPGEVPIVMAQLVGIEGSRPEQMRIHRVDPRLWEMARLGVSEQGAIEAEDIAAVRVVLYHLEYDLGDPTLNPAEIRLGEEPIPHAPTDDAEASGPPAYGEPGLIDTLRGALG